MGVWGGGRGQIIKKANVNKPTNNCSQKFNMEMKKNAEFEADFKFVEVASKKMLLKLL
jgi:hypothetical protein